ncbi:MAG: hypothetical protein JNK61_05940 [Bacteroidia bacterium]|nr:hypothetical protein [Bacteroidia bacterium]
MLKDIPTLTVTDIAVAIVPKPDTKGNAWHVYLLNLKPDAIEGVLVTSKGYGLRNGEQIKTSTLRHFLDEMEGNSAKLIEPIITDVFGLNNEYWVSFYHQKKIYDRKYLFLPESINSNFFSRIPLLDTEGVIIK